VVAWHFLEICVVTLQLTFTTLHDDDPTAKSWLDWHKNKKKIKLLMQKTATLPTTCSQN